MTWFYSQKTGVIRHNDEICGSGYAGNNLADLQCKNVPEAQNIHDHGPLPRGTYKMLTPYDHPRVGKYAIPLAPSMDNQMFGRMGFFIHGDSDAHPGEASDGCIVTDRMMREKIWASGDTALEVTE